MRHEHDGLLQLRPDAEQLVLHRPAGERVESAERLVHQQHWRVERQRAGEGDPLPHASGEVLRIAVAESAQRQLVEQRVRLLVRAAVPADLQAEGDVLAHGHPGKQRVFLEDHRPRRLGLEHPLAEGEDLPRTRPREPGDGVQQRGLAAAGRSEQADELARGDVQIDAIERDDAAELLAHAPDLDGGLRHARARGASAAGDG